MLNYNVPVCNMLHTENEPDLPPRLIKKKKKVDPDY